MKYIFVAGAPGSKWSSVVKNIYYSASIDRSDYRDHWTYYHDASGKLDLMHMGAYFDPGMESDLPEDMHNLTKQQLEEIFDAPFGQENQGIRIIKSHIFSNHIDFIRTTWPDCAIIMVHRADDSCLGWWVKCGHFDITYPMYNKYYKDLRHMAEKIKEQNANIISAWDKHTGTTVNDNVDLAKALDIQSPPENYRQNYALSDIKVRVI